MLASTASRVFASAPRVIPSLVRPALLSTQRSFSSQRVAPSVWGFSGKQASALFAAAQKTNSVQQLNEELKAFLAAYDANYSLRVALVNPLNKGDKRQALLAGIFPRLKINSPLAKDIISKLAEARGLSKLKKVLADYEKLASFARNEVFASVVSAEPLSADQAAKLTEALKKRIDPSEKLVLTQKVDSGILGGLKIFLDNKLLDLSVASKVKVIDRALRGKA